MAFRDRIEEIRREAFKEVSSGDPERARSRWLGRKGLLRELFREVAALPADKRRAAGEEINRLKRELEEALAARVARAPGGPEKPPLDVTVPAGAVFLGRRHVITQTLEEIESVYRRLGFDVVEGPEIETRENNFDKLNIPPDHPSADAFDTFFIDDRWLLRSHTSPVQIRAMEARTPPLRIIVPGRVFRPDTTDASHLPQFHQVEGLMVGEDVSFAHLKTTLLMFARIMFGPETRVRFRPSYFPFTEPSAEVDVSCFACGGRGCAVCRQSGWIEILGSGMVHPNVFRAVGYDPERWTGFAFGMGVERIAMIRHGIRDIRLTVENHLSFLRQFPP